MPRAKVSLARMRGYPLSHPLLELGAPAMVARQRLAAAQYIDSWALPNRLEAKIHQIHAYPTKFPAFLVARAVAYAEENDVEVKRISDVFCGSGTVACEARRLGLSFWGCDINPVATLIARTKSSDFCPTRLATYALAIYHAFAHQSPDLSLKSKAIERLHYWFEPNQFSDLAKLLNSINIVVPQGSCYRYFFHCAFSAILKAVSQWKSRAVKPSLDKEKKPLRVLETFHKQCRSMTKAWNERVTSNNSTVEIHTQNVMSVEPPHETVDLIITSPPYGVSYDYADLHQLSALWLGFTDDFRNLRAGSIGSTWGNFNLARSYHQLNSVGTQVVFSLFDQNRRQATALARYYLDMQSVAARCRDFLRPGGLAVFLIGNTRYRGVSVDNAAHLSEALLRAGFSHVKAAKRRLSQKYLTPFRDPIGRLCRPSTQTPIYSEEFILIAHL